MRVYHGTIKRSAVSIVQNGILLNKSKNHLDFGKGFYTTSDLRFAVDTASAKNIKANENRYLDDFKGAVIEFDFNKSLVDDIKHLSFSCINLMWAQFIVNNRNGTEYTEYTVNKLHNLDLKYDIVSGAIADGRIVSLSKHLKVLKDNIKYSELCDIKYSYETEQISFHTG